MKYAIYGAGAMGTALGAYVAKSGREVDLITRNRAHVSAMNQSGITVCGTTNFTAPARAYLPEDMPCGYDVIILAAKQTENIKIANFLKDKLAESGVLCTIQNGLPEYALAQILGEERVLGCACSWGATLVEAGKVKLTSAPEANEFLLGSPFDVKADSAAVRELLSLMGKVVEDKNFLGARWTKLIINSTFSPLSGMTGLTFGEVAKYKDTKEVAMQMFNEGARVCRVLGVKPAKIQGRNAVGLLSFKSAAKRAFVSAIFPTSMKKHYDIMAGMYYDLVAGKPCEINEMSGLICKYGKECGIQTPYAQRAVEIIGAISRGERAICRDNIKLFNS